MRLGKVFGSFGGMPDCCKSRGRSENFALGTASKRNLFDSLYSCCLRSLFVLYNRYVLHPQDKHFPKSSEHMGFLKSFCTPLAVAFRRVLIAEPSQLTKKHVTIERIINFFMASLHPCKWPSNIGR